MSYTVSVHLGLSYLCLRIPGRCQLSDWLRLEGFSESCRDGGGPVQAGTESFADFKLLLFLPCHRVDVSPLFTPVAPSAFFIQSVKSVIESSNLSK